MFAYSKHDFSTTQTLLISALALIGGWTASVAADCKNTPGSPGWPNTGEWQSLNTTLGGRLLNVVPPGAVCHPGQPTFNNASCASALAGWVTEAFHASNPFSTMYNDEACLPSAAMPCSKASYPAYVVDARTPSQVQATVAFAYKHNIRVTVKATGHDYNTR